MTQIIYVHYPIGQYGVKHTINIKKQKFEITKYGFVNTINIGYISRFLRLEYKSQQTRVQNFKVKIRVFEVLFSMKRIIILLLLLASLFSQLTVAKAEQITYKVKEIDKTQTAFIHRPMPQEEISEKAKNIESGANSILPDMEFETVKLEKGRKFIVVSEQNLNNGNVEGIPVRFESVQKEYLTYDKKPSKIVFKGKIEKTHKPRMMGKSGTVKIALEKITVDSITYPVTALISKIDNKKVFFNTIGASPCYLSNLADAANNGVIHSSLKDPCGSNMCTTNTYTKPLAFLGAAALQIADLMLSPFVAVTRKGNDVDIPLNTYFEIKLDKDLYVLNI